MARASSFARVSQDHLTGSRKRENPPPSLRTAAISLLFTTEPTEKWNRQVSTDEHGWEEDPAIFYLRASVVRTLLRSASIGAICGRAPVEDGTGVEALRSEYRLQTGLTVFRPSRLRSLPTFIVEEKKS